MGEGVESQYATSRKLSLVCLAKLLDEYSKTNDREKALHPPPFLSSPTPSLPTQPLIFMMALLHLENFHRSVWPNEIAR